LRNNIQKSQLSEYEQIGDEKQKEFYDKWEAVFNEFEEDNMTKIEELKYEHEQQMDTVNQKLDRAVEAVK
jgi:hypothetical protein